MCLRDCREVQSKKPETPANVDPNNGNRPKLKALYDCPGNGVDELGFKAGDIIMMMKDQADGWYEGMLNNKSGFIPATYVEKVVGGGSAMQASRAKEQKRAQKTVAKYGGAGAAVGALGAFGAGVKCDWIEQKTDEGDIYYYNNVSGESSWEQPPGFKASGGGGAPKPAAPAAPAKSDWVKQIDPSSGSPYYYNEATDESSWDPPPGFRG